MTGEITPLSGSSEAPDLSTEKGMESAALEIADSALPEEKIKETAEGGSEGAPSKDGDSAASAPKEPTAVPAAPTDPAAPSGPPPAPDTLTGEVKKLWEEGKIDPVVQAEFIKRENDIRSYVAETKLPVELGAGYLDVMAPYLKVYQAYGQNPVQMTADLHRYHAVLMFGTPEQKANVLLGLANDAGIPLSAIAGYQQSGMPQRSAENRQTALMANELNQIKSRLVQEDGAKMEAQIEKMWNNAEEFPYFQDLAPAMIEIYKGNPQMPIETAYRTALAGNPKLMNFLAEQKAQKLAEAKVEAERKKVEAARKARGTRLDSSSPVRPASGRGDALDDLGDILAEELQIINSR